MEEGGGEIGEKATRATKCRLGRHAHYRKGEIGQRPEAGGSQVFARLEKVKRTWDTDT